MAQQDRLNQDLNHKDQPMYLGKSIAVMCYCLFIGFGLAGLTFGWLAIRAHYQGNSSLFSTPQEQMVFMGLFSVIFLAGSVMFFLVPTLQAQFPKLRFENQYSLEAMEERQRRSIRYGRKHRKVVVQHAPKQIRLAVRFCTWTPGALLALLIFITVVSQTSTSPAWLNNFYSGFNALFPGAAIYLLFIGVPLAFDIPKQLLLRRARHLYDRRLRRLEFNADFCPECDYPIDPEQRPECCPECGVNYPI